MSKWIDADAFKRCLQNYRPYVDSGLFNAIQTEVNQVLDCIEYEIDDAPSIDIVRCVECRHWRNTDAEKIPTASIACGNMHADDFCSYGERNDNEF